MPNKRTTPRRLTTRTADERDMLALYRTLPPIQRKAARDLTKAFHMLASAPPVDMPKVRREARTRKGGAR